jgi:hypothetical protein
MCWGTVLLCGTLVVMVPTRDGLVAAADSRVSNQDQTRFCDEDFKLIEIQRGPSRTVATITGNNGIKEPGDNPNFCNHLRQATIWLDLKRDFKSYIESQPASAATLTIAGFRPNLEKAFAVLPSAAIPYLKPFTNRRFSLLVVASFDPETSTSWIRYGTLALTTDLKPIIFGEAVERIDLDHEKIFYRFGEKDYADQMLDNGVLARKFRDAGTLRFLRTRETVRDVTRDRSINVAIDFIEAVSAMTSVAPAPSGIGGPVDVLFIGRDTRQRILWKNVPD